jgi:hypothetical protein
VSETFVMEVRQRGASLITPGPEPVTRSERYRGAPPVRPFIRLGDGGGRGSATGHRPQTATRDVAGYISSHHRSQAR